MLTWIVRAALLIALLPPAWAQTDPAERRSSYDLMAPETRAMQDEDTANPGMLWLLEGAALWAKAEGPAGQSCASCHGDAKQSMKGVAARYPAFDAKLGAVLNLEGRINTCRTTHQNASALAYESQPLLALTTLVAHQSRGMPIESVDSRLRPAIEAGRSIFEGRQGQLNLACVHCHTDNAGQKLAGITVPQGHPTGYPLYRLEWQALGSVQRRLRNCLSGMRAESYAYGSPELIALETYLIWRAKGMPLETPAVRP